VTKNPISPEYAAILLRLLGISFAFFCLACVLAKNANVLPNGLAVCCFCTICAIHFCHLSQLSQL